MDRGVRRPGALPRIWYLDRDLRPIRRATLELIKRPRVVHKGLPSRAEQELFVANLQGITMSVVHIFRLIQCKTCASKIDIEYLGPSVDVRIAGTISNPGHLRCPKCGDSHKYSGSDIPLLHQGSRASPGALVAP
jgi:hypothetical protein